MLEKVLNETCAEAFIHNILYALSRQKRRCKEASGTIGTRGRESARPHLHRRVDLRADSALFHQRKGQILDSVHGTHSTKVLFIVPSCLMLVRPQRQDLDVFLCSPL